MLSSITGEPRWMTDDEFQAWIETDGRVITGIVGAVLFAALVLLIISQFKRILSVGQAAILRGITMPVVLGWEAQGLHQLVVQGGVSGLFGIVFAGATSLALMTFSAYADKHYEAHGTLGWPGRLMWITAVPMGIAVSFTEPTIGMKFLRLLLPCLIALVWWVKYAPIIKKVVDSIKSQVRKAGASRWTWNRFLIAIGARDATDADVDNIHTVRQKRLVVNSALGRWTAFRILRPYYRWKLRRSTKDATPEASGAALTSTKPRRLERTR